ncbi:MAG: ParB/Srx family N-terminal domain-containing protein [Candidatus Humimicrobiaceae bacterium]
MNEKMISVNVANLFLNLNNPRLENTAENQRDAIIKIIEEQKDKLVNLASDIVAHGLNAMERIAVTKIDENTFIVREGNRRIAAIKLLAQPNLIEGQSKNIFEKFKQLNKKYMSAPIFDVDCVLYENENLLNRFIEIKHTGENDGIGIATWDVIQKRRFKETLGKHSIATKAINFILDCNEIDDEIKTNIHHMIITNFERLIGDPYVRKELGISASKNGPFVVDLVNYETFSLFIYVIRDLIFNKSFNVRQIYYREDRRNYIEEVRKILSVKNTNSKLFNKDFDESNNNFGNKKRNSKNLTYITSDQRQDLIGQTTVNQGTVIPAKEQGKNKLSNKRKTLIPSSCKINIKHSRLNKIYHELCKLEVKYYPNACSVIFKTFIELSVDVYAKSKDIQNYDPTKLNLAKKIEAISQYLLHNKIITKKELKPIELLSDPKNLISANTFNAYVHNSEVIPLVDNLKDSWDSITYFMQKIYE